MAHISHSFCCYIFPVGGKGNGWWRTMTHIQVSITEKELTNLGNGEKLFHILRAGGDVEAIGIFHPSIHPRAVALLHVFASSDRKPTPCLLLVNGSAGWDVEFTSRFGDEIKIPSVRFYLSPDTGYCCDSLLFLLHLQVAPFHEQRVEFKYCCRSTSSAIQVSDPLISKHKRPWKCSDKRYPRFNGRNRIFISN